MADYAIPKVNTAYIFYGCLVSQADTKLFKSVPTLAAGDFKISIDGGAFANLATLPTNTPGTFAVKFSLSAAEMNGDNILVVASDAAGAEWCDQAWNIQTAPRGVADLAFPATSGRSMVVDAAGLVDANAVKVGPTGSGTAQTAGDIIGDTNDIQSRLPAALVGGRMDSNMQAAAAGVITAAVIADGAIDRATFAADTGLQTIRSNTAQTGSSNTITLDAAASASNDEYNDCWVYLTGGTGAGQARRVHDYTGSNKVAEVAPDWITNPDATTTFAIVPFGRVDLGAWLGTKPASLVGTVVPADIVSISGDATAADNAEAFFDGTGYAGTNNVIPTVSSVTGAVGSISGITFPTNFAALGINASGHISRVTLTDTTTTNTDMRGTDNAALASVCTEARLVKLASLTFTVANTLNANVLYVNSIQVDGAGSTADPWGPV